MSHEYSENILVQESAGNLLRDELGWDVVYAYNQEVLVLTDEEIKSLEDYINSIVKEDVEVTEVFITQAEAMTRFDMSRLPEGASDMVRVVHVGNYDQCLCAGTHVKRTGEIGTFRITSTRYADGVRRIVFKLG